ncbi:Citrate synthase [Candidatus Cyrtobacter comes]|uniref:Citrate synthase n=1 Tax=Candidatus Cyrtobacter comes TaxID=675776 RepID=A0ABU5L8C6_9RICK|nr:citrate synthase [Candidatus Cyrtobacter comes]MDZ5762307.1 Citrate synthase [Candidatus Cyrtobacter comes]
MKNPENAHIKIDGLEYDIKLPVVQGSDGTRAIDIRDLYKNSGVLTYDPGFMSTAACKSSITYIDGDKGILRHAGYDISYLVKSHDFMDICFLLLNGNLPNDAEKSLFVEKVKRHYMVHEQVKLLYRGFPRNSHPMALMVAAAASLSAFYHDKTSVELEEERNEAAIMLIAKIPVLAAMAHKYSVGYPFVFPSKSMGYAENFLHMMFSTPMDEFVASPNQARALEELLILHADHEQNASTSTVRLAGSTRANIFAVVGAGISSLWGPAHGGANEAVIHMLQEIGHESRIPEYIKKAKNKDDPFRLMGFGHRIYKNYDPRSVSIRETCMRLLNELNINDPLLDIALKLQELALEDEYFIERKLYPNVDFYSGIVYRALGIPTSMFTVMFAVARTAGWVAQWKEMIEDPDQKIGRPRQVFTGIYKRD